jgi:hypothetical protein
MAERFLSDGENKLGSMRILTAFLASIAILVGLLAGAVVALAGGPLPYVVLGIVIGAVAARRRRQRQSIDRRPVPPRHRAVPPRQRLLPGRWVYVPVWVGPPPQPAMPVIEAEFVRDPRRG